MDWFRDIYKIAVDTLLPPRCGLCQASGISARDGFCRRCSALLPFINTACKVCGSAIALSGICGQCLNKPPPFEACVIPFRYAPPVSTLIQKLKYGGQMHLAASLCCSVADRINSLAEIPDILAPVPLHWRKMISRGFNQATELSREIGRMTGIPSHHALLNRIRNTPTQTGLNEADRQRNVARVFLARNEVRNRHIGLVDDVVTSGSTIRAAANALKSAGAGRITIIAIAKT